MIAGRCHCGVLLEIAARDPRDHRECLRLVKVQGEVRQCVGPCGQIRPVRMFYPDRVNKRRQSFCRYCAGASSRKSYRHRYRTDEAFRRREIARVKARKARYAAAKRQGVAA